MKPERGECHTISWEIAASSSRLLGMDHTAYYKYSLNRKVPCNKNPGYKTVTLSIFNLLYSTAKGHKCLTAVLPSKLKSQHFLHLIPRAHVCIRALLESNITYMYLGIQTAQITAFSLIWEWPITCLLNTLLNKPTFTSSQHRSLKAFCQQLHWHHEYPC